MYGKSTNSLVLEYGDKWGGRDKMDKKITHKLSLEVKKEIWSLVNKGFSINAIAKKYGVNRKTVYRLGKEDKYKN